MRSSLQFAAIVLSVLWLGGCATSRSVLDIPVPVADKVAPSDGKAVYINSTRDKRVFEANPSSPNIPSLDPGESQGGDVALRAVGRKRNTFGKALGDILLKEGQTVETLTAAAIREAFVEKGYRVIDSKDRAGDGAYVVDAEITKFWSWMNPGFAAIALSTEISTTISIKSPTGTDRQNVSVKASDNYQTGMEDNWIEVMKKALRSYIDDLKNKLK
jgi:hypothetical protein